VLTLLSGVVNRMCDLLRLRRLPSPFFYAWCLPDPQIAWLSTLRGILLGRRCQSIYASCSPFSSAISGCLIKLATGTPLVLDFRDPWALNPHANRSPIQKRVLSWLEKWVVGACNVLILNTPGAERLYRATYPADAHKMTCIPNGLDQLNEYMPPARGRGERFVIMHVGEFYRSRKPDRLLEALVSIGNPNIEFVQVGPVFESYPHFKDKVPIRIINSVPHARALELMREASMLYVCQGWEPDMSVYVQIASKTYEYLATGLPILAECPAGDNADLIRRYANRAWVVTPPSVEDLGQSVTEAYALRDQHSANMNPAFLRIFDRRRLTGELAMVLDSAADGAVDYSASRLVRSIQLGQAPETTVD
jgi:glycosyltransferase involved in cell wall biosynthesis